MCGCVRPGSEGCPCMCVRTGVRANVYMYVRMRVDKPPRSNGMPVSPISMGQPPFGIAQPCCRSA